MKGAKQQYYDAVNKYKLNQYFTHPVHWCSTLPVVVGPPRTFHHMRAVPSLTSAEILTHLVEPAQSAQPSKPVKFMYLDSHTPLFVETP